MTYKQWQQAFVAGDKSGLREIGIGDKINPMNITNEWTKNTGIEGSVSKGRNTQLMERYIEWTENMLYFAQQIRK